MAVVDKAGRLVRFTIRPGNAAEAPGADHSPRRRLTGELIADKAYDSAPTRLSLASQGIVATIPPRVNRRVQTCHDPLQYRTRHLVENYFGGELLLRPQTIPGRGYPLQQASRQLLRDGEPGLLDHRDQVHMKDCESPGLQAKRQIPRIQHSATLALGLGGLIMTIL